MLQQFQFLFKEVGEHQHQFQFVCSWISDFTGVVCVTAFAQPYRGWC